MAEVQKRVAKGDADAKKELKEITDKYYEDLNEFQTDIIIIIAIAIEAFKKVR